MHSLLFVLWLIGAFANELYLWRLVLHNVNLDFVLTWAQVQFLLCTEDIVLFFPLIHLLYIYLHLRVGLDCFVQYQFAFDAGGCRITTARWVKYLVV